MEICIVKSHVVGRPVNEIIYEVAIANTIYGWYQLGQLKSIEPARLAEVTVGRSKMEKWLPAQIA